MFLLLLFVANSVAFYQNPVSYGNFPDPGVLRLPKSLGYVAVTTSDKLENNSQILAFPLQWSPNLVNWSLVSL